MTTCTIKTILYLLNLREIVGQFFPALRPSSIASWCKQRWSRNPVTVRQSMSAMAQDSADITAWLACVLGDGWSTFVLAWRTNHNWWERCHAGLQRAVACAGMSLCDGQNSVRGDSWEMTVLVYSCQMYGLRFSRFCMQYWPFTSSKFQCFCLFFLWSHFCRQAALGLITSFQRQQPVV